MFMDGPVHRHFQTLQVFLGTTIGKAKGGMVINLAWSHPAPVPP